MSRIAQDPWPHLHWPASNGLAPAAWIFLAWLHHVTGGHFGYQTRTCVQILAKKHEWATSVDRSDTCDPHAITHLI